MWAAALSAMVAVPAQAAPIAGGISFSDGFDVLPGPGSTTIVSQLTLLDVQTIAQVFSTSGSFGLVGANATTTDIVLGGPAQLIYTTQSVVFTFTGVAFGITRGAPSCAPIPMTSNDLCNDTLSFSISGTVSDGIPADNSQFFGTWTGNGSCVADLSGVCQSSITGSWSASLTATGQAPSVPEPATLGLLGITLAALGFVRRRKQA